MRALLNYIKNIFKAVYALGQGMYITMLNFIRPKVTEKYPENRGKKKEYERLRASLTMPHDENNQHKCTACLICMNGCPNGSIKITVRKELDPETGKEKRVLGEYIYNYGSCIFCSICVWTCPQGAIEWSQDFEGAVFTRSKLTEQLNKPGSSLKKKEKEMKEVEKEPVKKEAEQNG